MYSGRIDQVIRWSDGSVYPMDTKTTSRLGSYWLKSFRPYLSFAGYIWGVTQVYGEPCTSLLLNGISTAKNPRDRFLRDFSTRIPAELTEFVVTVQESCYQWFDRLENVKAGVPYQRSFPQEPYTCGMYSGCAYRNLCMSGCSEAVLEAEFQQEPWEPYKEELNGGDD